MNRSSHIREHLYAFRVITAKDTQYYYETDEKFFTAIKPGKRCLEDKPLVKKRRPHPGLLHENNPWNDWYNDNPEMITAKGNDIPINYLKSTDHDVIQEREDRNLLDLYTHLIRTLDIKKPFGIKEVRNWHHRLFKDIYPFAGQYRTVEMSKTTAGLPWIWRLEFLAGIPELDEQIKSSCILPHDMDDRRDIHDLSIKLSKVICDFLFIHPFREGNGRISRLIGDMILAMNGFPLIGMNLKTKEDRYIRCIHDGYQKNYDPLAEVIEEKIIERIDGA